MTYLNSNTTSSSGCKSFSWFLMLINATCAVTCRTWIQCGHLFFPKKKKKKKPNTNINNKSWRFKGSSLSSVLFFMLFVILIFVRFFVISTFCEFNKYSLCFFWSCPRHHIKYSEATWGIKWNKCYDVIYETNPKTCIFIQNKWIYV